MKALRPSPGMAPEGGVREGDVLEKKTFPGRGLASPPIFLD